MTDGPKTRALKALSGDGNGSRGVPLWIVLLGGFGTLGGGGWLGAAIDGGTAKQLERIADRQEETRDNVRTLQQAMGELKVLIEQDARNRDQVHSDMAQRFADHERRVRARLEDHEQRIREMEKGQ